MNDETSEKPLIPPALFGDEGELDMSENDLSDLEGRLGDVPVAARAEFAPLTGTAEAPGTGNMDLLLDVVLHVTVELGRTSMSIREVLALGSGSVVELDKLAGEAVDILVNGTPIAKGEVVVVDEKFGVRITDIVSPAKRMSAPL